MNKYHIDNQKKEYFGDSMESFFNLIKQERQIYKNYIMKDKVFPSLKIKLMDFILYTPHDKNLFIQSFNQLIDNKSFELFVTRLEKRLKLKNEFNLYINRNIDDTDIPLIKKSLEENENMIYLYKEGKHVTNLFNRFRNGIAHGNFYILEKRFIIWNLTNKNNISFFMNIKLSDFDFLHRSLIQAIL